MRIEKKEFVTEISGAASLSELCENTAELGSPCMLIVHTDGSLSADAEFPCDIPFITAAAVSGDISDELRSRFDLVIPEEETIAFTEKLFKDKTPGQVKEINKCFIAARKGTQEDILECESRAFYRLMAAKNGGGCNE